MTNDITLSRATLDALNSLITDALTTDYEDTRHDCICEAHRLLNPGDWKTATPEDNAALAVNEPQEPDFINQLKQSKMNVEAEALTAGQMNLHRILTETPDYELLCKIVEQAKDFDKEEEIDLTEIADNAFSNDLDFYPAALRGSFLDGFFTEAKRTHREVCSHD